MMARRIHKDCPFTADEINEFHAMLYSVNTSFHCVNPAPFLWVKGYQNYNDKNNT